MNNLKDNVEEFWNKASCGEDLYLNTKDKNGFIHQMKERYTLEPYILDFAKFNKAKNKKVLEIGVGLGADHQKFAEAGADLFGIDLTERAINNTKDRLNIFHLKSVLNIGDAENLSYEDEFFNKVYSWGVIHHSPDTPKIVHEIYRVLKKGGEANIMIYHKYSFVGYMLWIRYALLRLKPFTSLSEIYSKYLESPGTKAYTVEEANDLFHMFSKINITTVLTHGDLLESNAGQRHRGILLNIAKILWPRFLIKMLFKSHGLFMLITVKK